MLVNVLSLPKDYFNAAAQRLGELQANAAFQANAAAAAVSDQLNSLESKSPSSSIFR